MPAGFQCSRAHHIVVNHQNKKRAVEAAVPAAEQNNHTQATRLPLQDPRNPRSFLGGTT
jgi:hypothetical protein